ncbi:MAG: hypothetical protein PF638_02390 [Candidatus Delongbacteria bacterium]|jgi:hypothetical protein|nr:hypothetical protein [Candidatus Delongbacteria bacterium]
MKILNNKPFLVFILFLSIFLLFSNGRITSSMDVDVVRYSQNLIDTGSIGSESKLSNGTVYSPKTGLFYPLEGLGIIVPVGFISYISKSLGIESTFLIFSTGALFFALTLMFMFKLFLLFVSNRKALLYTALLGLATPIFAMSKMLFPEPFVMFAISGSIYYYFKYSKDKLNISLFLSGLFTGLTLIMRPDSPILYILTINLVSIKLLKENDKSKKYAFFFIGIAIFTFVFFINNFIKFGSILETGYTVNKYQRANVLSSLEEDLKKLPIELQGTLVSAQRSVEIDKSSEESQTLVKKYYSLDKSLKDKTSYLEKIKESEKYRINGILANKGEEGFGKLIKDYFYGLYLILIFPNRAIFFLSPVLLFIFFGINEFYKRFKIETIIYSLVFFAYLSLYALRAPYGYSGTAAWGIRYMLPMFLILSLFFIGFDKYVKPDHAKYKMFKYSFFSLLIVSGIFQLIGSSINYQHVQMPLENVITQVYGKENIRMSRIQLMTKANSSLLLNNAQILTGNVPQVIKPHLSEDVINNNVKPQYTNNPGPNDWFFYDLFNDGGLTQSIKSKSNYKIFFFLLISICIGSIYLFFRKKS